MSLIAANYPKRIICLTEESVETLYLLGKQDLIVGVSAYVKRPTEAQKLVKVSSFLKANVSKIKRLKPDLVLGFSDIQKDIAYELVAEGIEVWIANHRSLQGVLDYILKLGALVGASEQALSLTESYIEKVRSIRQLSSSSTVMPKVYFEEWDEPIITGIQWVGELIDICGGMDIFSNLRNETLAKNRIITREDVIAKNPDIFLGCWCGKPLQKDTVIARKGWDKITAIQNEQVHELPPEIFLQPGPALFEDGLDQLFALLQSQRSISVQ
ncbi:MAG: cobalamin-binding protein [Spirochaetota bacterium]